MESRRGSCPPLSELDRLAALAGLPDPITEMQELNGTSLLPVFVNPDDINFKSAAYSQFAKPSRGNPYAFWPTPARNATEIMGYSVRVDDWRCTIWFGFDGKTVCAFPLFHDFDNCEDYVNVSNHGF